MGRGYAEGLAQCAAEGMVYMEAAIEAHLSSNHYPPIPHTMVPIAVAAIEAYEDEDFERVLSLPEGVEFKGQSTCPAHEAMDYMHLYVFLGGYDE